ncbi:hypothetical protein [Halomonas sp.]|uniref:hypothetical protein n=1 Tax=Halomonas sp. TaxID=1486246 RepID=UPI003D1308A4
MSLCPSLSRDYLTTLSTLQQLCLEVSASHPDYVARFEIAGHLLQVTVDLVPRANLAAEQGGNGTYRRTWTCSVHLPGNPYHADTSSSLRKLNQACAHLAGQVAGGVA